MTGSSIYTTDCSGPHLTLSTNKALGTFFHGLSLSVTAASLHFSTEIQNTITGEKYLSN